LEKELTFPSPHALEAAKLFAAKVTVPVCYGKAFPEPIGTGTLIRVANRLFIVTAAHVIEGLDLSLLAVPSAPQDGLPLGISGMLLRPPPALRDEVDVAVMEVSQGDRSRQLEGSWGALTLEDMERNPNPNGVFALCGYPSEKLRPDGKTLRCVLIAAFTERIPPPANASGPINDGLDLFFKAEPFGVDTDGDEVVTPNLRGCSGAAIWQYTETTGTTLWTPKRALKVVGVQSSAMNGEWFRAKSWATVLSALRSADAALEAEIERYFPTT
jgi:hypothetical protein